jgi:hypothetical protein
VKRVSPAALAVSAGGVLGALLLAVAEFMTLFEVHSSAASAALQTVSAGSHHSYAMIPIALLAVFLTYGVWLTGSRVALLALAVLGVIALLIALVGDLPDAQTTGLLRSSEASGTGSGLANATSSPAIGLYLETLGGVLLLIAGGLGLLALGDGLRGAGGAGPAPGFDQLADGRFADCDRA